jgi:hypothetical protein
MITARRVGVSVCECGCVNVCMTKQLFCGFSQSHSAYLVGDMYTTRFSMFHTPHCSTAHEAALLPKGISAA